LVLSSLELSAHSFQALEGSRHAEEGLPCCPVTSRGSSGAVNGPAGEEYQVKARYQVRANPLLHQVVVEEGGAVGGDLEEDIPVSLSIAISVSIYTCAAHTTHSASLDALASIRMGSVQNVAGPHTHNKP